MGKLYGSAWAFEKSPILKAFWGEESKREGKLERAAAESDTWTGPKGLFVTEGIVAESGILLLWQEGSNYLWSILGCKIVAPDWPETSYAS